MSITRFAVVVALLAILEGGTLGFGQDDPADEKNWLNERTWPEFVAARRMDVSHSDDALVKLLKERFNAGQQELRSRYVYWLQDAESLPQVYDVARRVVEARLEAGGIRSDIDTILREKLAFAKVVEKQAEGLRKKYRRAKHISDVDTATYFRATAELELLRVQKASPEKRGNTRSL
jgi:hypothetical protein